MLHLNIQPVAYECNWAYFRAVIYVSRRVNLFWKETRVERRYIVNFDYRILWRAPPPPPAPLECIFLREWNKLFLAHYLISFRTYEIKRFPVWWDCASLLETVGSGGNKFVPMFYTFPRCFSSKHFNPQFFSGACRTSHGARRCTRKLQNVPFHGSKCI